MNPDFSSGIQEPVLLDASLLEKYAELLYTEYGIFFNKAKLDILSMKLNKIASLYNINLWILYSKIEKKNKAAIEILLDEITVGHTYFFREDAHFKTLVRDLQSKPKKHITIWSAASSSGEEAYSIVMSLLEAGFTDFTILASDINKESLKQMHEGIYRMKQPMEIDEKILRKYFKKIDDSVYQIRKDLRSFLKIKQINLHDTIILDYPVDYIFCRNVMIYFDEPGRAKVIKMLTKNLAFKGLLFVGHSEAMLTIPSELQKEGPSFYRKTV